ncbi:MAG: GNAT family N-acetyltransferase [Negativicutes bacterium]|nr:GNAT family N-acetyltransferase [Negativicutes bacterium]
MGAETTIRMMNIEDYEQLIELWTAASGVSLSDADSRENIAAYLDRNSGLSYVATANGGVVGAVLGGHDRRRGYLHHLAVSGPYRGKGIGKSLVERCLAGLQAEGIRRCNLFILTDNEEGMGFWSHLGFQARDGLIIFSVDI